MKITGQVIKLKDQFAIVRSSRPESCEHCSNSGICNKKEVEICAFNDIGAENGDYVTVETNEDRTAPLVLSYLFLTPLIILFLCYYLYTVSPWLAGTAVPMLAAYYIVLRRINRTYPVRARVIGPALPPQCCEDLISDRK